jgi:dTDP-4-amino-4,6-dideoxygalactose transaminase
VIGGNFRLDALHAAVVTIKLRHLDHWTEARQDNARSYHREFADSGLAERGIVTLPRVVTDRHVFNQYVIRAQRRDELRQHLGEQGVSSAIYYPRSLHEQECFVDLEYHQGDFPQSERASRETLALPIYPEMTERQVQHVVREISLFYQSD